MTVRSNYTANAAECDGEDCTYIGTCLIIADACFCPECAIAAQDALTGEMNEAFANDEYPEFDEDYDFTESIFADERDFDMTGEFRDL